MIDLILWAVAVAISLPLLTVSLECLAALGERSHPVAIPAPPRVAILVPAHDEAASIIPTLTTAKAQMAPGDRLVVIADNCSDDTAAIARDHGAEVIERHDPDRRGKGYALAFGRDHLRADPPGVVLVLDADTLPAPGAIHRIAAEAVQRDAALQGLYLIEGASDDPRVAMSTLAFRLKNFVRQKGLQLLSGHALLQGSGMAFPWRILNGAPLASASLVEDLQLGVDLFLAGERVGFAEQCRFTSGISSLSGTLSQRTRWEHGSMASSPRNVLRLLGAAFRGRWSGWTLALDQTVPPLGMVILLSGAALLLLATAALLELAIAPLVLLCASLTLFALSLFGVWYRWGRDLLPASTLHRLALYLFWKMPLFAAFLLHRERQWVRTVRHPAEEVGPKNPPSQFP